MKRISFFIKVTNQSMQTVQSKINLFRGKSHIFDKNKMGKDLPSTRNMYSVILFLLFYKHKVNMKDRS